MYSRFLFNEEVYNLKKIENTNYIIKVKYIILVVLAPKLIYFKDSE